MNVVTFIKAPYPFEHTDQEKWNTILYTSAFLSLIIFLLQPYGFLPSEDFQLSLGYLSSSFLVLTINYFCFPYFFPKAFEDKVWSVSKAILFLAYNFLSIGFWNHIIHAIIVKDDPSIFISGIELSIMLLKTLLVGSIASFFFILVRYNVISRNNLQYSQDLNEELKTQLLIALQPKGESELIELVLDNKNLSIPRQKLKYISSKGNYLSFHFNEEVKKGSKIYRGRIKHMEESLKPYPEFFRCHRSFIVNIRFIESTRGNSQGLSIRLQGSKELLPVARGNIKQLKLQLEKVNRSSHN